MNPPSPFGAMVRRWRSHRRQSQETLAEGAQISARHLSCLEAGKASPSREMVLVLANALEMPLRERNLLLGAAGFAPIYRESLLDGPDTEPVRRALGAILAKQEPYGAVVFDRGWTVLQMNDGAGRLFSRFPPTTGDARIALNLVRSIFHPAGLRQWLVNWTEVATATAERVHRDAAAHPDDEALLALRDEVFAYPGVPGIHGRPRAGHSAEPFVVAHLKNGAEEVRLFTVVTTLGTPLDVTAQELVIESYFPADDASERYLRSL